MNKHLGYWTLAAALFIGPLAGCGGNVVIGSGDGGGGGSGNGGGSTSTSSTGGTTSGTTTPSGPICDTLCSIGKNEGCYDGPVSECLNSCAATYKSTPQCTQQLNIVYQCAIDKVPGGGCDIESLCPVEWQAFQDCAFNSACVPDDVCSGTENSCTCTGTCSGIPVEVDCQQTASGVSCNCLEDGELIGNCIDPDPDLLCSITTGCCSQFF